VAALPTLEAVVDTRVIAHRGARRRAPENSLAAFRAARALGADGVELDVHRSADAVLVVHHDAESPAVGVLAEATAAEIEAALPTVPRLAAALDVSAGLLVNVEIKNSVGDAGHDPRCRAADALVELLDARGGTDVVLVSSFDLPTIDRVHELAPDLPTGYLTVGAEPFAALETARAHGHRAIHPDAWSLADGVAAELAAATREAAIHLNTWTVNDPDFVVELAEAGVDGIVTDVPDVALRALGREPASPA
jgi:glycerophosphoryl diester phosphodiesterase